MGHRAGEEARSHVLCTKASLASRFWKLGQLMSSARVGGAALVGRFRPSIRKFPPLACHCSTAVLAAAGRRMSHTGCGSLLSFSTVDTSDTAQGCPTALATASLTMMLGIDGSSRISIVSLSTKAAEIFHSSSVPWPVDGPCLAILLGKWRALSLLCASCGTVLLVQQP